MTFNRSIPIIVLSLGFLSSAVAQYTPTISGVDAFWWLGSGILHDGAGCGTTPPGPCYYAQASWSSSPNGAPGTPYWTVVNNPGGGSVSLDCYTCANVLATATSPSNGCDYDVTVSVSYGGYSSAAFTVMINTPENTTLQSGYPTDVSVGNGYLSTTAWNVTDLCGYSTAGFDVNEAFGTFYDDYYGHNWGYPSLGSTYETTSVVSDYIGNRGWTVPMAEPPQSPLTSTKVFHDTPWMLYVFSQTSGSGVSVRSDTQQIYQDHGRHQ